MIFHNFFKTKTNQACLKGRGKKFPHFEVKLYCICTKVRNLFQSPILVPNPNKLYRVMPTMSTHGTEVTNEEEEIGEKKKIGEENEEEVVSEKMNFFV